MFFQAVLLALLALLPMVNPPTTATLLLGLSKGMSREHVRRQVNMAAIYLFCTLCITFFIGSSILDLFGISIPGLRLAGGLIIGFIGFRMLFPAPSQANGVDINQSIAFVPLTMPSMCGPGTMALVISGAAQIAELPSEYNRFTIYSAIVTAFRPHELHQLGGIEAGGSGLQDPRRHRHRCHDPHHGLPAGLHGYAVLYQWHQGGGTGSGVPWRDSHSNHSGTSAGFRLF